MNVLVLMGSIVFVIIVGVSVYPAFKVMPFAYGVSRVRAARAKMFSDEELRTLAGESYKDAIYQLEKRGLSDLLDLIEDDFREELVQKRLDQTYLEHLGKITRYVPNSYKRFFQAIREGSVYEFIVTVIRSKTSLYHARHTLTYSAETLIPGIQELSLEDFIAKLKGTPYHTLVHEHYQEIQKGKLSNFERAVIKEHMAKLSAAAGENTALKRYVKLMKDVANIREALCFSECVFLQGGRLKEDTLRELEQAKDVQDIVRTLHKTRFDAFTKDAHTVIDMERSLLKAQKAFADKLLREQPLSIEQMLSYYIHKLIELRNIRILLKLLDAKFKPETVRGMLV